MTKQIKKCPLCGLTNHVVKRGIQDNVQIYWCKTCNKRFRSNRRKKTKLQAKLRYDYIFHKQTFRELSDTYDIDIRKVMFLIHDSESEEKIHNPRKIYILGDTSYYGERKKGTEWGHSLLRDQHKSEDLVWGYVKKETEREYRKLRYQLEELGYEIMGITGDGFTGILKAFSGIPFQMCQVHMIRIVERYTGKNPKTEVGIDLRELILRLSKSNSVDFLKEVKMFYEKHKLSLEERTYSQSIYSKKKWWYVRRELRSAYYSILNFLPYLFTYEKDEYIVKTTNSIEAHFRHIKDILNIHCGISKTQKQDVIDSIMIAGTIAPKTTKKKKK